MYDPPLVGAPLQVGTLILKFLVKTPVNVVKTAKVLRSTSKITYTKQKKERSMHF